MSTSPYEHVNHSMLLSSSASSSMPRKLPPPFDPSALPAKVGRLQVSDDATASQGDPAPPPPPPRRMTNLGVGSAPSTPNTPIQQKRKPVTKTAPHAPPPVGPKPAVSPDQPAKQRGPPPVAKKPAHLTGPVSPASSFISANFNPDGATVRPSSASPVAATRNVAAREEEDTPPPQPPRRANTASSIVTQSRVAPAPACGIPLVGLASSATAAHERKPQLPARKPTAAVPARVPSASLQRKKEAPRPPAPRKEKPVMDLLGDEEGLEMSGWEALKPS
jgi:hypothetical protein